MFKKIKYTLKHKKYFLKVEKELVGKNSISGYLHDLDKVFLYIFLPKKLTHKLHRWYSKHHVESFWKNKDWKQAVIDWECARYTKPDKPLTAHQCMNKLYKKYDDYIIPVLIDLNLYEEEEVL